MKEIRKQKKKRRKEKKKMKWTRGDDSAQLQKPARSPSTHFRIGTTLLFSSH
jgi:hypothetical protein